MPSAASRSPSEFPLTAQTDLSHSSPGQGDLGDDDHDCHVLDDLDDDDHGDAFDDDEDLVEYFSTEEMRGACLLSPVSNACADL